MQVGEKQRPTPQKRLRKGAKGRPKTKLLLRATERYSLLRDAYCIILRDEKRGRSKDKFYSTIPDALHAVYHRLLEDGMEESEGKELADLQRVIEETRKRLRKLLEVSA